MDDAPTPTLSGWLLRDAIITGGWICILWACHAWYNSSPSWPVAVVGATAGFIATYTLCYIYHEWGHYIGARLKGVKMPLHPYTGALLGRFDIPSHSPSEFLGLSWGGVIAYVLTTLTVLTLYALYDLAWVGSGLAVGGLAFVTQSLSVDLPQIWRVAQGADPLATNAAGASPKIILRRTWQSWLGLSAALLLWNMAL